MSRNNNVDILKQAYDEGFKAFQVTMQNDKGIYSNPHNTYPNKGLPYKEFERGYNAAYFLNKKVKHD